MHGLTILHPAPPLAADVLRLPHIGRGAVLSALEQDERCRVIVDIAALEHCTPGDALNRAYLWILMWRHQRLTLSGYALGRLP